MFSAVQCIDWLDQTQTSQHLFMSRDSMFYFYIHPLPCTCSAFSGDLSYQTSSTVISASPLPFADTNLTSSLRAGLTRAFSFADYSNFGENVCLCTLQADSLLFLALLWRRSYVTLFPAHTTPVRCRPNDQREKSRIPEGPFVVHRLDCGWLIELEKRRVGAREHSKIFISISYILS